VIPFGGNVITEDIKVGCSIIERQAELLKEKFGSAWPGENKESEIVSIPGLRGRDPKEISLKRLSQIIHARVQEILEQSYLELKHYGCDDQKKKLIAGIVMTGGGSKLKHIRQLTEYLTGMDVRIGFSNEHIVGDMVEELSGPEYATSVGLLMKGLEKMEENQEEIYEEEVLNVMNEASNAEAESAEIVDVFLDDAKPKQSKKQVVKKARQPKSPSIFTKWTDKFIQMINETE